MAWRSRPRISDNAGEPRGESRSRACTSNALFEHRSEFKTTQLYIDLAGEQFRPRALARCSSGSASSSARASSGLAARWREPLTACTKQLVDCDGAEVGPTGLSLHPRTRTSQDGR